MKFRIIAALCVLAPAASIEAQTGALPTPRPAKTALAAAGRQAKLGSIDHGQQRCDNETTVETWLNTLDGRDARCITWSSGNCQLVSVMRAGFDASSWPWCAQARVALVHPKSRDDTPMIEIFLEKPVYGRPGAAYAFRSLMMTRDDGPDYERFRQDFAAEWREHFPPGPDAAACTDD